MLRITATTEKGAPALKLEGRVGGPWVDELRDSWSTLAKSEDADSVKIDMRGVSYVDHRGADLLVEMENEGASFVHCSDFIRQLMQAGGHGATARKLSKRTTKES